MIPGVGTVRQGLLRVDDSSVIDGEAGLVYVAGVALCCKGY